jgi:hypothetical protein
MPPLISNDGSIVTENNKLDKNVDTENDTEHNQQAFSVNNKEHNYTELVKEIELTNRTYMNLLTK